MPGCAVFGCGNYSRKTKGSNIRYFRFPKNELSQRWVIACHRQDEINLKDATICSVHFAPDCFEDMAVRQQLSIPGKSIRNLKSVAIPTLNIPGKTKIINSERPARLTKRKRLTEKTDFAVAALDVEENIIINQKNEEQPESIQVLDHENESEEGKKADRIIELEKKVTALENENRKLVKQQEKVSTERAELKRALGNFFSAGQIKRILNPNTKYRCWSPEDIASAISLRSVSPKAYRYLRANGCPLPALSTLRNWAAKFSVKPGILTDNTIKKTKNEY